MRQEPDWKRTGVTWAVIMGDEQSAKVYITVNEYEDGRPCEIFIKMSKVGSTLSGFCDWVAKTFSLALQYGVPIEHLAKIAADLRFEPSGRTDDPEVPKAHSVADYAARKILIRYEPTMLKGLNGDT